MQKITLERELVRKIWHYGGQAVVSYTLGNAPRSAECDQRLVEMGRPAGRFRPEIHALGKAGEAGCCLALGLDPNTALDWNPGPDDGYDLIYKSHKIDVKAAPVNYRLLIWPYGKEHFFFEQPDVILLFATVHLGFDYCSVEPQYWITKSDFAKRYSTADRIIQPKLVAGTWFVERKDCDPIETLINADADLFARAQ